MQIERTYSLDVWAHCYSVGIHDDVQVACPIQAITSSQSEVLLFYFFFHSFSVPIHLNAFHHFKTKKKTRPNIPQNGVKSYKQML